MSFPGRSRKTWLTPSVLALRNICIVPGVCLGSEKAEQVVLHILVRSMVRSHVHASPASVAFRVPCYGILQICPEMEAKRNIPFSARAAKTWELIEHRWLVLASPKCSLRPLCNSRSQACNMQSRVHESDMWCVRHCSVSPCPCPSAVVLPFRCGASGGFPQLGCHAGTHIRFETEVGYKVRRGRLQREVFGTYFILCNTRGARGSSAFSARMH